MKNQSPKILKDQNGFVSIVVSIIIMTILSLITVGFAQLMIREQRQALDRQLSSQAFYAAESGINDAFNQPASFNDSSCGAADINSNLGVKYSCVTYTETVEDLQYSPVPLDQHASTVFPLPAGTARMIVRFTPNSTVTGYANSRTNNDLPQQTAWNTNPGAIKVRIMPYSGGGRQAAMNAMDSFTIIPRNSAPSNHAYNPAGLGRIVGAGCNAAGLCSLTIDSIPPAAASVTVAIASLYRANNVTIIAQSSTGTDLPFEGVQAQIDSTGKTTDVLRRIQVRKPLLDNYIRAAGGLEATGDETSDGICKLIDASPFATTNSAACN